MILSKMSRSSIDVKVEPYILIRREHPATAMIVNASQHYYERAPSTVRL